MRKRQVVVRRSSSSSSEDHQGSRIAAVAIRSVARYGECQKNHAAGVGGYAVDGCREFMASGEEGTAAALTCAACGCHRNFHRRELENYQTSHHRHEVVCECSSPPNNSSNGA